MTNLKSSQEIYNALLFMYKTGIYRGRVHSDETSDIQPCEPCGRSNDWDVKFKEESLFRISDLPFFAHAYVYIVDEKGNFVIAWGVYEGMIYVKNFEPKCSSYFLKLVHSTLKDIQDYSKTVAAALYNTLYITRQILMSQCDAALSLTIEKPESEETFVDIEELD